MEDAGSLRYGCLMHYYWLWCISIHGRYTSNFAEGKWFSQGHFMWWEVPRLAGVPKPWIKEVFMFSIIFKTQRFFMLDKYILLSYYVL